MFNTRLGLGLVVVGRRCWDPRWGGITKDSPEHGRTVLVDIYRLRRWVVCYGAPRMVPIALGVLD